MNVRMGDAPQEQQDLLVGIINLFDEIRSYCHDKNGVDCLLRDQTEESNGEPCKTCGGTHCIG